MELIKQQLAEKVSAEVKAWCEAHPQEITKAIDDAIAKGFLGLVTQYIEAKINWPLQEFANRLREKGVLL